MKHKEDMRSLRDMTDLELTSELANVRQGMFKFRSDLAMRSLADVKAIRTSRRRVARILTLAREREIASGQAAAASEGQK
ncbi:MAG TPA: 50S ribosomal protein L29 [Armatimonadota bacterium]|nr:50S ribosomal protein L29 [Armatimonadota bacterium]